MIDLLPRRLVAHPVWKHVAPAVTVESGTLLASGRKHRRFEVRTARFSFAQIAKILSAQIACAACGSPIHPFRRRAGKSAGRAERPGRLFIALTCELSQSIACSRGNAASDAYAELIWTLQRPGTEARS
jgi:hypothetical protein